MNKKNENLDKIIRIDHCNPIHKKIVVVNWMMSNVCNFSCSYCNHILHDGTNKWPNFDKIIRFIDKVCEHYTQKNKTIYFDLTGGEITLFKDLPRIIDYLNSKNCWIGLISNGSQRLKYWKSIVEKIDHICLSYHPESIMEQHFIDTVDFLHNEVPTHVNIMMEPNSFEKCRLVGNHIRKLKNISISYQPLVNELGHNNTLFDYSADQLNTLIHYEKTMQAEWCRRLKTYRGKMKELHMDNSENEITTPEILSTAKNNYTGWYCWAGVEQLVIDSFGEIYRAWCKQGRIGNINDEVLSFQDEPIICKSNYCHCQLDLAITKSRNSHYEISSSNESKNLKKLNLPFNQIGWTLRSDHENGGTSTAKITNLKEAELRFALIVKASNTNQFYALISFPWIYNKYSIKGIMLKMDLERGKIITIQVPLKTNPDSDLYQTQIIGEGYSNYYIYFTELKQQGYGEHIEWNQKDMSEVQFINEFTKNDLNITFKELALLYESDYANANCIPSS